MVRTSYFILSEIGSCVLSTILFRFKKRKTVIAEFHYIVDAYIFIQLIFMEDLLCAKHCADCFQIGGLLHEER